MGQKREDWAEIAEAWEKSGETQRSFAARRGISLGALQSWVYRRRRQRGRRAQLVEVRVAPPLASTVPVELRLPNGVSLRLAPDTEPVWAAALVRALLG